MQVDRELERVKTSRWPSTLSGRWPGTVRLSGDELQRAWGCFIGRMPWVRFFTLTFDPKRIFPVTQQRASREAFTWCNQVQYVLRRELAWAFATERGRSGLWHAHVLMTGTREARWGLVAENWRVRNGNADERDVYAALGVSLYMTKSAALGGEVVLSDTIDKYREHLCATQVVGLWVCG